MALAGSLEIQLLADVARLKTDMDKALGIVQRNSKMMEDAAGKVRSALGGIAGGLSVAAFGTWIKGAIDAADSMNDLSKSTDIAVGKLAGLKLAAKQSGSDLEGAAKSINKLQLEIGKDAEKFAKIGVTAKDGLGAFKQLADIFVSIKDPQLRAAVAAEALGKAWAGAAPLLSEGSQKIQEMVDKGELLSGMTQDAANAADEFNDRMAEMETALGGTATQIANGVLPLLTVLVQDLTSTASGVNDLDGSFNPLNETLRALIILGGNVAFTLRGVGTEIGGIAAQIAAIGRGDFKGALSIGREMTADAEKARAAFDAWEKKILAVGTAAKATAAEEKSMSASMSASRLAALKGFADQEKASKAAAAEAKKAAAEAEKERKKEEDFLIKWGRADAIRQAESMKEQWKVDAEAAEDAAKAVDELFESRTKLYEIDVKSAKAGKDQLEAIQFETRALSMTNVERETAIALRELERSGMDKSSEAYKELAKDIEAAVVQREAATEHKRIWDSIDATAHDVFVNIFEGGSNAFKKLGQVLKASLLDLLYQMTVRKWIISIGASMGGGVAQAATGGGSLLSTGASLLSGSFGAGMSGASAAMAGGTTFGTTGAIGGYAAATGVGGTGLAGAAGSLMSGASAVLGAIPVWGWAALGVAAIAAMVSKGGGPKTEAGYSAGGLGIAGLDIGGNMQGSQRGDVGAAQKISEGISGSYEALAKQLGLVNSKLDVGIFYAMDNAKGGTSLTQLQVTSSSGYNRGTRAGGIENVARGEEELKKALAEETLRVMFDALKNSDLTEKYKAVLDAVAADAGVTEMEAAIKRITDARTQQLSLEEQLYQLTATDAEKLIRLREQERAAVDPLNAALLEQIYARQDELVAIEAATAATKEREAAEAQRLAEEKAKADAAQEAINAASEAWWNAQMQASVAAEQAAKTARDSWAQTAKSIEDAMKALRGEMLGSKGASFASAQGQFAIATAQARAGDQEAARSLPALAKMVQELGLGASSTRVDYERIVAATLASLGGTLGALPSYDVGTPFVQQTGPANIHRGERILTAAENGSFGEMAAKLDALNERLAGIERNTANTARSTGRTDTQIQDWSKNGVVVVNQPSTTLAVV